MPQPFARHGYKVWPAELDSILYEHPAIHEACVIAIDDARRSESVKALVVLKPSHCGQVSEQETANWGRESMDGAVAELALFLGSRKSKYVTCAIISVDGGSSLGGGRNLGLAMPTNF